MPASRYFKVYSVLIATCVLLGACANSKRIKRAYTGGWYPKKYDDVQSNYNNYLHYLGCEKGETIASIGAGTAANEVAISCFVDGIDWYLQDIDSVKLYQFENVLEYFKHLKGSSIDAEFHLFIGTEKHTKLPGQQFDRIILNNVYHELSDRKSIMYDVKNLLRQSGKLVIMEPMAKKKGDLHSNCGHLRLYEPEFLPELKDFGFSLVEKQVGEEISFLTCYTFQLVE